MLNFEKELHQKLRQNGWGAIEIHSMPKKDRGANIGYENLVKTVILLPHN